MKRPVMLGVGTERTRAAPLGWTVVERIPDSRCRLPSGRTIWKCIVSNGSHKRSLARPDRGVAEFGALPERLPPAADMNSLGDLLTLRYPSTPLEFSRPALE
jgi:hypothetical protein